MDIAIIGGGFYGCYLAKHLSKNNKVYLYEKNSKLIQNQEEIINIVYIWDFIIQDP